MRRRKISLLLLLWLISVKPTKIKFNQRERQHRQICAPVIIVVLLIMVDIGLLTCALQQGQSMARSSHLINQQAYIKPRAVARQIKTPAPSNIKPNTPAKFVPDYTLPEPVNGLAPVIATIPTNQPIVFLGIDDGAFKDPSVVELMKANHIKASLFISQAFILDSPVFFKQLADEGSLIENHTINHNLNMVTEESYEQQKTEICEMADYELQQYGRRPVLFRPPGGAYSETMQRAAHDCGMKAVVTWIAKASAGSMQYQIGDELRPGDIVLMHFRPEFKDDLQAFINATNAAGLHTELIEDAIK